MQLPYLHMGKHVDMVPMYLLMGKQGLGKEKDHSLSHASVWGFLWAFWHFFVLSLFLYFL